LKLIFVIILGQALFTEATYAQVIVSIPDSEGLEDSTVVVPVNVDLKTYSVISYYFEVNYNPEVVEIVNISTDETLSSIWSASPTVNANFPGKIIVGAFSTGDTILGKGCLVNLECRVMGVIGDTTNLHFGNFMFNNGFPAVYKQSAIFTVVGIPSGVKGDKKMTLPSLYSLDSNYPDPFRDQTTIRYKIARREDVTIKIFNSLGQEVITLLQGVQQPNSYYVSWNGRDKFGNTCKSGLYYCQLRTSGGILTEKMLFVK